MCRSPAGLRSPSRREGRSRFRPHQILDLHDLRDLGRPAAHGPHGDGGELPVELREGRGLAEAEIAVPQGAGGSCSSFANSGWPESRKLPVNIELQLELKIDGNGEVIPFPGFETVLQVVDVCIDFRDGICGGADLHEKRRPVGAP